MPHFFFKLIPPRRTFIQDISPAEAALMKQHSDYLEPFMASGKIVAVGPVLNPQDSFGIALLEMADPEEVRAFGENDPSVKAGMNTFEFHPFRLAFLRR